MKHRSSLPLSENEKARIASVLSYGILDTEKEAELDELTRLTGYIFDVPIVLITILDEKRQWFKSNVGLSITETAKSISFCQYTIMGNTILEVENALKDERFTENPLVLHDPYIRYYCGAPLINEQGFKLGSLALIDRVPRKLDEKQKDTLMLFARLVSNYFELHVKRKELENEKNLLEERVLERTKAINQALREIEERDSKLNESNEELKLFIYKITHSLLGPIKTMEGLTSMLLNEIKEKDPKDYLHLLKSTELKMDQTLTSLIKFLTVNDAAGKSTLLWEEIAFAAFELARRRSKKENAKLVLVNNLSTSMEGNKILFELLFEELFTNSLQFNVTIEPIVGLMISQSNETMHLEIEDNGIGIKKEYQKKIYDMFFKSEQSKSDGLGLYLVKKIVNKLKGKISMESKPTKGTMFKISFPNRQ